MDRRNRFSTSAFTGPVVHSRLVRNPWNVRNMNYWRVSLIVSRN